MTVSEVARRLGRVKQTIYDWHHDGVAGERLRFAWIGGRIDVSEAALADFFERIEEAKRRGKEPAGRVRSPAARSRAGAAARQRLRQLTGERR